MRDLLKSVPYKLRKNIKGFTASKEILQQYNSTVSMEIVCLPVLVATCYQLTKMVEKRTRNQDKKKSIY